MATFAGFVLALGGILGGLLLEKGSIQDVAQGTAAMIVFGGTLGAVLITTPLPIFRRALRRLGSILFQEVNSTSDTIEALIQYATQARRNGIVSLETEAEIIQDRFLKKALGLAIDGTDLQEIRQMMEIDINAGEQSSEEEARVWESAGGYAPTVGIIGAVMGLIQVMKHLEDIKEVGHGIAVAFVATVYGVGSANIFFLPAANKIRARMRAATMLKELTLEGVAGIVEGLNPTLMRLKLGGYITHPEKTRRPQNRTRPVASSSAAANAGGAPASPSEAV
ncbi:MAG TPA: flagellar motor protein [Bryobacteraceae bacterium]|nr:flagellar motor protein [Bryobacteraceae bacterium]